MRPEEISELLGTDPESVIVAREQALEQLAGQLGMADVSEIDDVRTRLAELPAEAWTPKPAEPVDATAEGDRPAADGEPEAEPEAEAEPEPKAEAEAEPELEAKVEPEATAEPEAEADRARPEPTARRKSRLPLLLIVLAAAVAALVIALASGGEDKKTSSRPAGGNTKPGSQAGAKPAKASGPRVALAPLPGAPRGATGTAALAAGGKRLLVDVKGLPEPQGGAYEAWLYNSVIDARSLVKVRGTSIQLDLRLPAKAHRYQAVDISLEPNDGNPNHSGQSVLRVPLSKLSG